jgi:hypothetical protein
LIFGTSEIQGVARNKYLSHFGIIFSFPRQCHQSATTPRSAFIEAFETVSALTFEPLLAPSYSHIMAPASLNVPQAMDKNTFLAHMGGFDSILEGFPVHPKDIIENENANQVVIWATSEPIFHEHVMDDGIGKEKWEYKGEYILIFTMDGSGEQIERVLEFLDSKGTELLRGLIARGKKNRDKQGGF